MKLIEFAHRLRGFIHDSNNGINSLKTLLTKSEEEFFKAYDLIDIAEFAHVKGDSGDSATRKTKIRARLQKLITEANQIIPQTMQNDYEQINKFYDLFFNADGTAKEEANVKPIMREALFHAVKLDKYEIKDRGYLFMFPNSLINLSPKYRFNQDGSPCLYLGATLYNAWEETRRPDFEKANFTLYKPQKKLFLMSMYIDANMRSYGEFAMAYFALISARKTNDEDKHHYQYVVPNLFMSILTHSIAVTKGRPIDGIRYLSSRGLDGVDYQFNSGEVDEAFVFPQQINADGELDNSHICDLFKMTDPRNYFYYKIHRFDFGKKTARVSDYRDSLFYAIEQQLKKEPVKDIK